VPEQPSVEREERVPVSDTEQQRERLYSQDQRILDAVSYLATRIYSMPPDPKYPDAQPQALIVGGFVRDSMLGKFPKDADIEVYGVSPARLEEMLEQMFPGQVIKAGKSFGVLKVVVGEGLDFDVSIPRRESKTGKGHTGFTVESDPAMSVRDAAQRRDFTFNALAADVLSGKVYDEFGGLRDLEDGLLRVTDAERFQDDPLRVWRAVQFAARMNLKAEPGTEKLLGEMVARGDLLELPRERVSEELSKLLLKSERPSVGLEMAHELGLLERHMPELFALVGVPQEPEWHPEGDVWIHTKMVVDAAARIIRQPERGFTDEEKLIVMLGALCHDLGKPTTTEEIDGRIRSLGHEQAGVEPTGKLFERLSYSKAIEDAVKMVASEHLKPSQHYRSLQEGKIDEKQYANILRRMIRNMRPLSPRVLAACSESDSRGRALPDAATKPYDIGLTMLRVITEQKLDAEAQKDLINGRDVIDIAAKLGVAVKPGPEFGRFIKAIGVLRDAGEIETREQALTQLEELLRKTQS
jgi:tRNA nucleotidyltransferase (CCA-adding enzyme)